jgi:hypothetical protein
MLTDRARAQLALVRDEVCGRKNLRVLASDLRLLATRLLGNTPITNVTVSRLYNAALVQHEGLRLDALTWLQPAWKSAPSYSRVLDCLMHCLTCAVLGEERMHCAAAGWLKTAVERNTESRPHFTQPFREQLLTGSFTPSLLSTVSELRARYGQLKDAGGPYPPESFPYHYFAPEEYLLRPLGAAAPEEPALWPEVEELLVMLATEL